jgi:hypothetical protein
MSTSTNGTWKTIAVTALAALQALCFWTLMEIKGDIRGIQVDQKEATRQLARTDAQLAVIAARHVSEDVSAKPTRTP